MNWKKLCEEQEDSATPEYNLFYGNADIFFFSITYSFLQTGFC
jgi:hypothetical protein